MNNELQVERELKEFIQKHLPLGNLSLEMVKKAVWNENGKPLEAAHKFQDFFMGYFDQTNADLDEVLEICNKCWNAFPHKSLDGKSPNQMVADYKKRQK